MSTTTGESSKASKTQADIREVMSKIHNKANSQAANKPAAANTATQPAASRTTIVPNVESAVTQSEGNAFAKEIFLNRTNIADIAAEKLPERSATTQQKYQLIMYERYVQSPIMRISDPLHKLRFETRFTEGLLRMAIKLPLRHTTDYHAHKRVLALAGIKNMCFVDMSINNTLLKDQQHIISVLQSRFNRWSNKLGKLSTYLETHQRQKEQNLANERMQLKQQIKKHGNIPWHKIALFEDRILCELLGSPDNRRLDLWNSFAFDDDALNEKYCVGKYCRDPVGRLPMKTILERTSRPEFPRRTNASLSSAPTPSPKRPVAAAASANPTNELTFVPYVSSTQNPDDISGRRWSLTQHNPAQHVSLQTPARNPNDTTDFNVASERSNVPVMENDLQAENVDNTNQRTDQLLARRSHKAGADLPDQSGRFSKPQQVTEEEAMDETADHTPLSSIVARQPTVEPPAKRRLLTPQQIAGEEAMDVTVDDSGSSSIVATQRTRKLPGKPQTPVQITNEDAMDITADDAGSSSIVAVEPLVKRAPHAPQQIIEEEVTDLTADDAGTSSIVAVEPPVMNAPHAPQQIIEEEVTDLTADDAGTSSIVGMEPPVMNAPHAPQQITNEDAMDVTEIESSASLVPCAQPTNTQEQGYSLEYVKSCTDIYLKVMKLRLEKFPNVSLTQLFVDMLVDKKYKHHRNLFAMSKLGPGLRMLDAHEQTAVRAKGPYAWALEQLQNPIGTESSQPPVRPMPKTSVQEASALDVQETGTENTISNEHHRESSETQTEQRVAVQAKRQNKNVVFPGVRSVRPQNIVYEDDTPPVTEAVFVGSDATEADATRHNTTIVDPLHESNRTSFTPFVSSTQRAEDASSQQVQPDPPKENAPSDSDLNENQQRIPTVDTLSEPNTLSFQPGVSSTQNQDTNSQQGQPVSAEEDAPFETTSSVPAAIPVGDAVNDSSQPTIKQERDSQQSDSSGYAGYVEEVPIPVQVYTVHDSENSLLEELEGCASNVAQNRLCGSFQQSTDSVEQKLNAMFEESEEIDAPDSQIMSDGRFTRLSLKEIFESNHRTRRRPLVKHLCFSLAKKPTSTVRPAQPFDFLIDTDIESVRYTRRPTRWRGCNELQQNPLTVTLHHPADGIFTVSIRDHQVGHLLGLLGPGQSTSAGWEALIAALQHVGKFRYGRKEPTTEYYRMSVVEKVLHLFFDTLPSFPLDGGFVLRLGQDRRTFPVDGGTVNLERFHIHRHAKQRTLSVRNDSNNTDREDEGEEGLEHLLMPGIAEALRKLHKRIFFKEDS